MKDLTATLKQARNIACYYFPLEWRSRKTPVKKIGMIFIFLISIWHVIPLLLWMAYTNRNKIMGNFDPDDGSYEFI